MGGFKMLSPAVRRLHFRCLSFVAPRLHREESSLGRQQRHPKVRRRHRALGDFMREMFADHTANSAPPPS
jgi:hypothetical protein